MIPRRIQVSPDYEPDLVTKLLACAFVVALVVVWLVAVAAVGSVIE